MNQARDIEFERGWISGGLRFYPYQVGVGVSISFWPCVKRPDISVHLGPFKAWIGISGKRVSEWFQNWLSTLGV